jgi:hypothetical protein
MTHYSFSGHESFFCRQFWLKKGFDFLQNGGKFGDSRAVVDLGVGKNMASSIHFWLRAFGLCDDADRVDWLAKYILGRGGKDPYLEDIGTTWLLQCRLVNTGRASIYSLFFNEFRRERVEFGRDQLCQFLERKSVEAGDRGFNTNTASTDIKVFLRSYLPPSAEKIEAEDDYSALFTDLNLIRRLPRSNEDGRTVERFTASSENRDSLPWQILLFSILENPTYSQVISLRDLTVLPNSPGLLFGLTGEALVSKVNDIAKNIPFAVFSERAGVQVLQFNRNIEARTILDSYYED